MRPTIAGSIFNIALPARILNQLNGAPPDIGLANRWS
jgi:hypothetical protein